MLRIPGVYPKTWVPSLYLGGLTVVLGLSALALRQGPAWRVWLSAILVVSLLGSLGKYTSPIWAARVIVATSKSPTLERLTAGLGPVDKSDSLPIREDGFLRDGDGSVYWWLSAVLPGFRQFRFPAKLFTFTSLALAALAGLGWDRLCAGRTRGIAVLLTVLPAREPGGIRRGSDRATNRSWRRFGQAPAAGVFGPFDAAKGYEAILRGLAQAAIVLAAGLILIPLVRTPPPFRRRARSDRDRRLTWPSPIHDTS